MKNRIVISTSHSDKSLVISQRFENSIWSDPSIIFTVTKKVEVNQLSTYRCTWPKHGKQCWHMLQHGRAWRHDKGKKLVKKRNVISFHSYKVLTQITGKEFRMVAISGSTGRGNRLLVYKREFEFCKMKRVLWCIAVVVGSTATWMFICNCEDR